MQQHLPCAEGSPSSPANLPGAVTGWEMLYPVVRRDEHLEVPRGSGGASALPSGGTSPSPLAELETPKLVSSIALQQPPPKWRRTRGAGTAQAATSSFRRGDFGASKEPLELRAPIAAGTWPCWVELSWQGQASTVITVTTRRAPRNCGSGGSSHWGGFLWNWSHRPCGRTGRSIRAAKEHCVSTDVDPVGIRSSSSGARGKEETLSEG